MKPVYIYGAAGFARENYGVAIRAGFEVKAFVEKDEQPKGLTFNSVPIVAEKDLGVTIDIPQSVIISVGDPKLKEKIYNNIISKYPSCEFPNVIDPSCIFLVPHTISFGIGVVLHAWCLASYNVKFGDFFQSGSGLIVGHDCVFDDYVISGIAPSIAGKCRIGKHTRLGSNVATREGVSICNDVTLGVGSVVVKDITEPGIYVGNPAKRIK